jgi:hypothetical protein
MHVLTPARDMCTSSQRAQREWVFSQPATLELTHNWGTESDSEFKVSLGGGLCANTQKIRGDRLWLQV